MKMRSKLLLSAILGAGVVIAWENLRGPLEVEMVEQELRETTAPVCNRANLGKIHINPETGRIQICHG